MRRRGWWGGLVLVLAVAAAGGGCAARRTGGHEAAAGEVRRDAEGREYRVRTIPKAQAVRIDDAHVRTHWGITLDAVGEDATSYHYKLYEVTAVTPVPAATPSAVDRSRIVASYRVDVGTSRRLRFVPFGEGLPTQGQWRDGFDVADVDGDGALDIVHGPPRTGQPIPRVFLGNGRGQWRLWREAKYPPLPFDYGDAGAADLDGDGRVDLVLSSHLRGFAALRNDGGGVFTDAGRGLELVKPGGAASLPFSSRAFTLADWNGDGRPDVLALGEGPRLGGGGDRRAVAGGAMGVAVFLNGAAGWRRATTPSDAPNDLFGQAIVVGDFDGDRRADFATGSGTLGRTDLVSYGTADGGWRRPAIAAVRPRAYVRSVASGDFDRDGRDDLALAYASYELETWRTGVDVLVARAAGGYERRALVSSEDTTGVFAVATGDLDGDGRRDVVALSGDGAVLAFLGDGRGGFTRDDGSSVGWPERCRGVHVALRDLDRDGRDEIVAAFAEEPSDSTGESRCPHAGGLAAWRVAPR